MNVAVQRRARTISFKKTAAPMVVKIGAKKLIAVISANGISEMAQNQVINAPMLIRARKQ